MSRKGSKAARISNNRYFFVMGEGWYVLTREGVNGPYTEKIKAIEFVQMILTGSKSFELPSFQL